MKLRAWLQGAGASILILFPFCRAPINMPGFLRMHTPGSAASMSLALIVNLILVSLLCAFLGSWLRSTSAWPWLKLLLPAVIFASLVEIIAIAGRGWESTILWLTVLLATLFLTLLLHWQWRPGERMLLQLSGAVLIGLGFFWVFVVLQISRVAMWHPLPNSTNKTATQTETRSDRPKVVWILFDELSYQQVFGDRFPGLELPNFDEFRKSSTLFTNTQSLANSTDDAVPSMLTGERIEQVVYTPWNKMQMRGATDSFHPLDASKTPFASARKYGLTTGVAGWYNPYCGALAPYLNQCYWTDEFLQQAVPGQGAFLPDLLHPWRLYGAIFAHPIRMLSKNYRQSVIRKVIVPVSFENLGSPDYRGRVFHDLRRHAIQLAGPSGPDFVFLHLPVPHPPGFYNRKTQQLDASGRGSYIDNLALADKTLGEILAILRQSPRWKNTSVVICGDHSWRVFMWPGLPYWTNEDEAASHGRTFDARPFLMIHLAGQTTSAMVNEPFPLLNVHDILNDLVSGTQPTFSADKNIVDKKPGD